MSSVRDIINGSLRLIEELGAGQTPSAEDTQDAFSALLSMMDSWSIQGGNIFTEVIETFSLNTGVSTYTIGTGGDFNTARPVKLRAVTYSLGNDTFDQDLEILDMEEYAYQNDKTTVGYPKRVYYNANYPLASMIFHPVPSAGSVKIYSEKPLSTFTSINDTVVMPPGYERALKYNLAVEIAPEYGKQPSQTVMALAVESKNAIEVKNLENDKNTMTADDGLLEQKTFNIFSGL